MIERIDAVVDACKPSLPEHMKRRDPREPGRTLKEAYEDKLAGQIKRRFNLQKKQVVENVHEWFPGRKFAGLPLATPEADAKILSLMIEMAMHGLSLFEESVNIGIGFAEYSIETINVTKTKVAQMIGNIDDATKEAIQQAVNTYAQTPGMTIGQLEKMLPFQGYRARRIAITETTNLYASVENALGEKLMQQYPEVRVEKTWFTNNDDRVCEICGPLNGQTVEANAEYQGDLGAFYSPPAHPNCRCWHSVRTRIE
jgi:SPP1 gp7 family putative phage head morphogenesis protein